MADSARSGARLGIVGATGWLGQALGLGLLTRGLWQPQDLVLLNRSGRAGGYAAHPGVVWARDLAQMQALCDTIVLSVRPGDFPVAGFAPGGRLVISFMAGVPMARLRALAPAARIVRAMPNGNAREGASYTPWCGDGLLDGDAALVARVLSAMGREEHVASEDQVDVLSAISGSGPAYPALLALALVEAGVAHGLPREVAERAADAVVAGSAPALAGRVAGAGAVVEALRAYRGITAAGIEAAEAAGLAGAVGAAIAAAVARARGWGREGPGGRDGGEQS